jgi:hypothetical protein
MGDIPEVSERRAVPAFTLSPEPSLCYFVALEEARIRLPLLTLLWDVEQRTLIIRECCRVKDLDAGVVVAGKRRCGTRTACLHGIVRRVEPNPEVINLHRAIRYRARL